ncbi:unnamed protein product, partial [Mesorhabditis spiculigera]
SSRNATPNAPHSTVSGHRREVDTASLASTQASPTHLHTARSNAPRSGYSPFLSLPHNPSRPGSPSSTSSLDRRACRICQSETGDMVRPCGCAGTMGDIHETCLSKWVTQSHRDSCEICHENYARSGAVFKRIRQWEKPKFDALDVISLAILGGLGSCLYYLWLLMQERLFKERIFIHELPMRSDDYGRIILSLLIVVLMCGMIVLFVSQLLAYVHRQQEIRFINKKRTDMS